MPPQLVFRTALNYGAISGLASFAFFILLYLAGYFPLGPATWTGFWIPIVFMVLATRQYRSLNNDYLPYWTGWRVGFLTASSAGFLFALLVYIFGKVMVPDFLEQFKSISFEAIEKTKEVTIDAFGEKMYEEALANIEKMNLRDLCMQEFFYKSMGGIFFGLITAAIYRKTSPDNSI